MLYRVTSPTHGYIIFLKEDLFMYVQSSKFERWIKFKSRILFFKICIKIIVINDK